MLHQAVNVTRYVGTVNFLEESNVMTVTLEMVMGALKAVKLKLDSNVKEDLLLNQLNVVTMYLPVSKN